MLTYISNFVNKHQLFEQYAGKQHHEHIMISPTGFADEVVKMSKYPLKSIIAIRFAGEARSLRAPADGAASSSAIAPSVRID